MLKRNHAILPIVLCAMLLALVTSNAATARLIGNGALQDTAAGTVQPVDSIDTVYVYFNWNQIFSHKPAIAYSGPIVFPNNGLEYEIYTLDDTSQAVLDKAAVAINVGDSLWLVNTNYLKNNFECQYNGFYNYIPLYFSSKIAFCQYWDDYAQEYYLRPMLTATGEHVLEPVLLHRGQPRYYILDFDKKELYALDQKRLAKLLAAYPELRERYLSRKHRNDPDVIAFYFQKYIEAVDNDSTVPTIIPADNNGN